MASVIVEQNGESNVVVGPLTASGSFLELTDTGNTYSGLGGYTPVVRQDELGVEFVPATGTGDMTKATYDSSNSGIVDNAEALGGESAASVQGRIATLESYALFVPSYDYQVVTSQVVTNDSYENLGAELVTGNTVNGAVYEIKLSMLYILNSVNTSAFFRFSLDSGASWVEVRRESKDITDVVPVSFHQIVTGDGSPLTLLTQTRKEVAGDVLTVTQHSKVITRVV